MAGGSCQRGRTCQSGGMTTEGFQPEGERPDVPWGVLTVVLWVIAVIGFVGVPLAFHDEKQARDRAHRSEAEVAQVFGAAVEEGIAPAAARGNFVVTGMFGGQVCRVEYRRADGEWAGFLARRDAAGRWRFEDVFLTSGVRQGFVHDGMAN